MADDTTDPGFRFKSEEDMNAFIAAHGGESEAPTGSITQLPSVMGSTYEQALPKASPEETAQRAGEGFWGMINPMNLIPSSGMPWSPMKLPSDYDTGKPVQEYDGPLGFGQAFSREMASPLGPVGMVQPEAGVASILASEGARQLGAPGWVQTVAGIGAGGVAGIMKDWALLGRTVGMAGISHDLAREAGIRIPPTGGAQFGQDAAGQVLQRELRSTANPPNTTYKRAIFNAPTPMQATQAALADPSRFGSLSRASQAAIAAHVVDNVSNDPQTWLQMDPAFQRVLVPNEVHRVAITRQANEAANAATSPAAAAATRSGLQRGFDMLANYVAHHWSARVGGMAIGAGLGHLFGGDIASPIAEGIGAGLGAVAPVVRAVGVTKSAKAVGAAAAGTERGNQLGP